ncbi:meprin A subunit alpha [Clupea harengus]|uniref:Meprin A subunit n=1 Tax=Clupea harengus TaxID=7950 RepID=A0A6P8GQM8_CLUHA|nr:meprin A subunit alpha [Clupea harengus]
MFTPVQQHDPVWTRDHTQVNMSSLDTRWKITALTTFLLVLKAEAVPTHYDYGRDVDAGELREDIPDINLKSSRDLFEGDIAVDPRRNAILDEKKKWKFPIPYILTDSLELNAKGVILQALEMYRLKSCVDFKPYEGESTYLSFTKLDGCWSFVGDLATGQNLSIGARCDTRAIVEHELLHALGFYHEQSRSDRDDYVKIHWDQILEGKEHNFNKYEDDFITDLNTPYDYESIMHYRPLSFNKDPAIPTITTAIPAFNNVIGQRLDFSAVDLERLNRKYECAATLTLLDQCSFEQINICGMIQNEQDNGDWVQTPSTAGSNDHTLGGQCRDAGLFMHFDTSRSVPGTSALLESRILYPRRSQQCLQFFYKMSGGAGDRLVIWLRMDDGTGDVRKVKKVHTITGDGDDSWKIAHVALSVGDKFRYFFQGMVGVENQASSGISIDDITLTETACPVAVWQISKFSSLLASTAVGVGIRSGRFNNSEGYAYGFTVYPNGRDANSATYLGVTFHLYSGVDDGVMEWPAMNRQVIITAIDQDPDATLRMSNSRSFTSDSSATWTRPVDVNATWDESCTCYRGREIGWGTFMSHLQLKRRSFLKNDDLIITVDFDDLTHLLETEVPVVAPAQEERVAGNEEKEEEEEEEEAPPKEVPAEESRPRGARALTDPCSPNPCLNGGVCVEKRGQAACRCASGQSTFYTGDMCETQQIAGSVVGFLIGGAVGSMVLVIAIFAVIRQRA